MIKKQVCKTHYYLNLSQKKTNIILKRDSGLYDCLFKINGVSDIDYDYHFGNGLWLSIDSFYDVLKTWIAIDLIINLWLSGDKIIIDC